MILCLRRDDLCLTRQLYVVILLYILSAILFTSTTVSIAIYYARRKADTEEKTLITKNDYKKTILIFSIINFIASFAATALPHIADSGDYNHISIAQFSYLSLILAILSAGVVEFFIAKSTIFQRFSCSKADKTETSRSLCRNMRTVLHIYRKLTDSSVYNRSISLPLLILTK